jgi:hypothetical protein
VSPDQRDALLESIATTEADRARFERAIRRADRQHDRDRQGTRLRAALRDATRVRTEAARILASLPLDPDAHAHRLALTEDA